jgi:glycosyltransferase involved in cell wall biosynthesis
MIAESAEAIAASTAKLLEDPHLRRALGERALAFVAEHYSAEAYGHRLEGIYEEVVSRRKVPTSGER